ncbi:TPA: Thioredoxin reductase 1 [Trebouxia sp. C0004]
MGAELTDKFRAQSERFGTRIFSETVEEVDFSQRPFKVKTHSHQAEATTLIIATGAVAKRLAFKGSGETAGFWNKGISACAVCDGAAPMFRKVPLAVGGDSAMEEALFLTRYGSKVYIIHRRDEFRASKIMQKRALDNPKIEDLQVNGLFFAIGHEPASKFLKGQLKSDADGYILTTPGSTKTSIDGVYAAGDVQDKKFRQAITAAGTGCMAALEAEHFLQEHGIQQDKAEPTTTENEALPDNGHGLL